MAGRLVTIRNAVLNNKGTKIVALLLAVASWYAIRKTISHQMILRDVPLEILVDEGWAVLDRSANSVDVLFVGSQNAVAALSPEHVRVEIDLRGKPFAGSSVIELQLRDVRGALGGVRVVEVEPSEVTVSLDQEGEAHVPAKAVLSADLPVGYEVEKTVCTPASVTVYGPRRRLEGIESVPTEPINLKGRVRSFELRMPVLPPSESWVARIEPDSVMVHVTLAERSATKEFTDVRVSALVNSELAPNVRVWPNKVTVTLSGRSDLVDVLQREDLRVYVDCAGLDPSASYTLPLRVHAPPGIAASQLDPELVDVELGEM